MLITSLLIVLILSFLLFRQYFRRDPDRVIPAGGDSIIAPADGRITFIGKAEDDFVQGLKRSKEQFDGLDPGKEYTLISIFMCLWDVHVQRIPVSGRVVSVKHIPGQLLPVMSLEAGFLNEKTETILETGIGLVKVIQIAGIIARRIDTYFKQGDECEKGERLGMIHFGSRVNLLIPSEAIKEISGKTGDKVRAGETVLVRFKR